VSSKTPQYTILEAVPEPSALKKLKIPLFLLLSLSIGYLSSHYFAGDRLKSLRTRNSVLEDLNAKNEDTFMQQKAKISKLAIEIKVKNQAILQLQEDLTNSIKKQGHLQSEIKFYEKLLSPNAENKGLRVFQAKLSKQGLNEYELNVILVQKLERAKTITGKYQIQLKGKLNQEGKILTLAAKDQSNYNFKYFHPITLAFSVPEGFKAEQLVVKLFPKRKKSKTVEFSTNWDSLTKQE